MYRFNQKPWKHDLRSRKFSHERFFGSVALSGLPDTLGRDHGPVLDQGATQRCTGYGSAANGYYIHGVPMSPDWQAYTIGRVQGRSVDINGGDPNSTMKAMRDYGFLPATDAPFTLQKDGVQGSGYDAPWPKELDTKAKVYDTIPGYVRVDGQYDTFDNIRNALYQAYDPKTGLGACVDAFSAWYGEWTYATYIPSTYRNAVGYHHYIFVDWVLLNGQYFLVAQNSYGNTLGAQGFQYFPREVVNREFSKYGTSLKICKTLTKEQMALAREETVFGRIQRAIIEMWYLLSNY